MYGVREDVEGQTGGLLGSLGMGLGGFTGQCMYRVKWWGYYKHI